MSSKDPIIVAGPTGAGKTAFAALLASQLGGEIIGADAYQVYRGLEILTSQPEPELQARIPHHLVGFLDPAEPFDAARFVSLAQAAIEDVSSRGKIPILVGGSGLYLKALTHGLADLPPTDPALREELGALPAEECRRRLVEADPSAPDYIDLLNPRRVQRALEIFLLTGRTAAELRQEWKDKETPGFRGLLLERDKEDLDARIAATVDAMFQRGVVEEVRRLGEPGPTARLAIGLREVQALLAGTMTEAECREKMILATRRYAKRQLTWFRNQFTFPPIRLTGPEHTSRTLPTALQALGLDA